MNEEQKVQEVFAQKPLDPEKVMILVGFGKKDLFELVALLQAGQEDEVFRLSTNVPPRWRRLAICDEQDVENMRIYTEFLANKLARRMPGL